MNFSEEMLAEDEKRWHARDVVAELGYCGNYMRDRKNMTNLDIRFYAYLMRKAHEMLKAQEPVLAVKLQSKKYIGRTGIAYDGSCGNCSTYLMRAWRACPLCGQAVKWNG